VKRLYIAGDDDQTIFTWAGASERFIKMPGNVRVLKQSFRVPRSVQTVANRVIKRVTNRREKDWNPRDAEGSYNVIEGISQLNVSDLDPEYGSVMMLGRTVKMLKQVYLPYCRQHGLLYRYFENASIKPVHAYAIDAWTRLQEGYAIPADDAVRIYDLLPSEGHGKKPGVKHGFKSQLNRIADQPEPPRFNMIELRRDYGLIAEGQHWKDIFVQIEPTEVEYIEKVLKKGFSILDKPHVHISTIHRVKGGQANRVILLSDTAKAADKAFTTNNDDESRVFYTGITRTYEDLVVVQPRKKYHYEGLFA
jgi:hypothetical protein